MLPRVIRASPRIAGKESPRSVASPTPQSKIPDDASYRSSVWKNCAYQKKNLTSCSSGGAVATNLRKSRASEPSISLAGTAPVKIAS